MKYILFILVAMVLYLGIQKQIDSKRIDNLQNALTLTQSENKAYRKEIEVYNEKQVQASSKIAELRKQIQTHKDDQSDGYRCFDIAIPDDIALFLHNK